MTVATIITQSRTSTPAVAGPKVRAVVVGPRLTSQPVRMLTPTANQARFSMRKSVWLSRGKRSAAKVTRAAMLTRNVSVYSMKVMPALSLTAQPPNSSSLRPLPPLPSVTQRITRRYIAETTAIVKMTNHRLAPKVISATPAATIRRRKGPKT